MPLPSSNSDVRHGSPRVSRRKIRKSCHFCRSRKIKCSGHSICDACRVRKLECSYNEGERKGRPRTKRSASMMLAPGYEDHCHYTDDNANPHSSQFQPPRSPAAKRVRHERTLSCRSSEQEYFSMANLQQDTTTCAIELARAFCRTYAAVGPNADSAMSPLETKISYFRKYITLHQDQSPITSQCSTPSTTDLSDEELFCCLGRSLLQLQARKLGCIESGQSDWQYAQSQSRYFISSFQADSSLVMFDSFQDSDNTASTAEGEGFCSNPLLAYDSHEMLQYLEIWFSQHPLSFMLSKTLVLRSVRQECLDQILLAVLLSDVETSIELDKHQLQRKFLPSWINTKLANIRSSDLSLSTLQAILLLGWRALCRGQGRRALVYLCFVDTHINTVQPLDRETNIVNGIDVGAVEEEVLLNTRWLLNSILVWFGVQIDASSSFLTLIASPRHKLPSQASDLAMFRLDRAAGSISTLQHQEATYQELWAVSTIASFVSRMYTLQSETFMPQNFPAKDGYNDSTVPSEQRGSLRDQTTDTSVCDTKLSNSLLQTIQVTFQHTTSELENALQSLLVHTAFIHLSISSLTISKSRGHCDSLDGVAESSTVAKLLDEFCRSSRNLYHASVNLQDPRSWSHSSKESMSHRRSSKCCVSLMAVDACARGLHSLWTLSQSGTGQERQCIAERQSELCTLATDLHQFCRSLRCENAPQLVSIIEKLELVMCYWNCIETETMSDFSAGSGSNRPTANAGGLPSTVFDPRLGYDVDGALFHAPVVIKPHSEEYGPYVPGYQAACLPENFSVPPGSLIGFDY